MAVQPISGSTDISAGHATFPATADVALTFSPHEVSFLVENSDGIIEVSFDGSTIAARLDAAKPSQAIRFPLSGPASIFYKRISGTNPTTVRYFAQPKYV